MAVRIRELNTLRKYPGILTAGLLILLCGVFVVSLLVGDANVPLTDILKLFDGGADNAVASTIVMEFRLPRALAPTAMDSSHGDPHQ